MCLEPLAALVQAVVGGGVIHDQQLNGPQRLAMTALQGCRDAFGVVEGADADRDLRPYPTGVLPNHLS